MISYSIYVVDDEQSIREGIRMSLETSYQVKTFSSGEAALESLEHDIPDLLLLDIGLPGINGIETLQKIKKLYPTLLVIMITAFEDIKTVVSAMKCGAYDYVVKPLQMDSLEVSIRNALDTIRLRKEVHTIQERFLKENLPCFIGESDAIQDVMEFVSKLAESPDTPILILGETGTGKELIASAIHYRSPNFKGPLITVNCAAIPKDLIESELFGYEKGAFSGAHTSGKKGLIEEAKDGTLFLDEVGDLSLEAQAKLLRFLEEDEYYKVGGTKKHSVKTRVVSATNKDLESMVENGNFRKDLYFRLGVIKVEVPSLNERRDDIIPIAKHFLVEFNKRFGKHFTGITPDTESTLKEFNWIGNVRELRNLIERGVLTGKGQELTLRDLGLEEADNGERKKQVEDTGGFPPIPSTGVDLSSLQESFEKYYLEEALKMSDGNESNAARLLHMNHHTFRYRRKKLDHS